MAHLRPHCRALSALLALACASCKGTHPSGDVATGSGGAAGGAGAGAMGVTGNGATGGGVPGGGASGEAGSAGGPADISPAGAGAAGAAGKGGSSAAIPDAGTTGPRDGAGGTSGISPIQVLVWNLAEEFSAPSRIGAIPYFKDRETTDNIKFDTTYALVPPPPGLSAGDGGASPSNLPGDTSVFTEENLDRYDVVLFLNATGLTIDGSKRAVHRQALQDFIEKKGRGFVGTQWTADSYRGGSWPWFIDFIGTDYNMNTSSDIAGAATYDKTQPHSIVVAAATPNPWNRTDMWFTFNRDPLASAIPGVKVILTCHDQQIARERPCAWVHEIPKQPGSPSGGRMFYTGVGYRTSAFQEPALMDFIIAGIKWAAHRIGDEGGMGGGGTIGNGAGGSSGAGGDRGTSNATGGAGRGGSDGATACQSVTQLDRSCTKATDCSILEHQTSCCGDLAYLGLNNTAYAQWQPLEAKCELSYPACTCRSGPGRADDGSALSGRSVTCVQGVCTTYATVCGNPCASGTKCFSCEDTSGTSASSFFAACTTMCADSTDCHDPTLPVCQSDSFNVADMYCTGPSVTCK